MKKIFVTFLFTILIIFISPAIVFAKNNPDSVENNKFGIHINSENDLKDAATLVNSSGGDWGYVTFVITENERDRARWQRSFDEMRRKHLIPIIRIATNAEGEYWKIPSDAEINNWVAFLNSLNWVIQNRYIIIGNEPNHAKEWGGEIDPATYATYLNNFARKLHEASTDFFVLPAGLDASAKNTISTMDEALFLRKMLTSEPNLFDNLDGWTSHSYPNPDFSGSEYDKGKGSINTYDWELTYLQSLGIMKYLPVFITETGWSNKTLDPNNISEKYEYAFKNIWNDPRIIAVTPFILNYPDSPFEEFTWRKKDGTFYPYYDSYKNIEKVSGNPIQIKSGQILGAIAQPVIGLGSDFVGAVLARNTGQNIWNTYNLFLKSDDESIEFKNVLLFDIEPPKTGLIIFKATSKQNRGVLIKSIFITDTEGNRITNSFPIEALIVKVGKMQYQTIFDKLLGFVKSEQFLNTSK